MPPPGPVDVDVCPIICHAGGILIALTSPSRTSPPRPDSSVQSSELMSSLFQGKEVVAPPVQQMIAAAECRA